MLCGGRGDRWPIWCLTNELEGGVQVAGLFHSLFGHFISLVVINNVCVTSYFADGVMVMRFS